MSIRIISFIFLCLFYTPNQVFAHGAVQRASELKDSEVRLFIADNMDGSVVVIDFPNGEITHRVSTSPSIMILALSRNNQYIYAMRGRDTDEDLTSIISTGFDVKENQFRKPHVIRTIKTDTPGGPRDNKMATVGGYDAILTEGEAEVVVIISDDIDGYSELKTKRYKIAAPDHYHYLEGEDYLYIGHLFNGFVQVLNRSTGEEVKRIQGCPRLHGMTDDKVSGRLIFSCARDVIVVGTLGEEKAKLITRIPYPENTGRGCAAFLKGKGRVQWCYTEGVIPRLYRVDFAQEPYQFTTLSVESSIQQNATDDGQYLMVLSKQGVLYLYDGGNGKLIKTIRVSEPFLGDWFEDVGKAILPDIASHHGTAYITLTHEGRIAEIDLEQGEVKRYIDIDGFPTRIVLLAKETLVQNTN
jgi:hypothetical protein